MNSNKENFLKLVDWSYGSKELFEQIKYRRENREKLRQEAKEKLNELIKNNEQQ